ncbi:twin-arginine translocation signal domain-containing protein [Parapedobacter sp.]|nr:twin-arginine translocation signal domain-containing protein [Parapedobacter sp.]
MKSRRSFLKKAALLAGTTAAANALPDSIQRLLNGFASCLPAT